MCLCQCTRVVQRAHVHTHVCRYVHIRHGLLPSLSLTVCPAVHVVTRLKGFSSAYELVKSEKNKIVTLIQQASQVSILMMCLAVDVSCVCAVHPEINDTLQSCGYSF